MNASPYKKILIINTFGIGDVLFTTPLISNLKMAWPDVFIGYIANRRTAPVLQNNSKINKVFIYERDEFQAVYKKSKLEFLKKMNAMLNEIRREDFDAVIDLSMNGSASFLMWFIGIKNRIGFNYKNRSPFLNHKIKFEGFETKHVADYYLDILKDMGLNPVAQPLENIISAEDRNLVQGMWNKYSIAPTKKVIGLIPGGGASWGKDAFYKRWPPERYAKLADKIVEKLDCIIILMGSHEERGLCRKVVEAMKHKALDLSGQTTIAQLGALSAKCQAVLVNDGGPLHIAVASGAKTVSIFGPVDDVVYGPYPMQDHVVIKKGLACQPCYRRFRRAQCEHVSCLTSLTEEEVFERMSKVL